MANELLTAPGDCCGNACPDPESVNIPGPQGPAGADGEDGLDGENARTETTQSFVQPAIDANVTIQVTSSTWATATQELYIGTGGYYLLVSKPTTTSLTVKNRGYTDSNAPPTTVIASGVQVGPAGLRGIPGEVDVGGALLALNNLSDVDDASTSRSNLGLGTMAVATATDYLAKAGNLSGLANNTTARDNLGVEIGVDVQAFSAFLLSVAGQGAAADRIIYTSGVNTALATAITALARTLIAQSTAAAMRSTLGSILPRYGILGSATAVDMNSANNDNAIVIESSRYIIDAVIVENASISLTTATAGLFTAVAAGGTTIAADQALSALTASTKFKDLTLQAVATTDVVTTGTIYFRTGAAQGAPATANVWILGRTLS